MVNKVYLKLIKKFDGMIETSQENKLRKPNAFFVSVSNKEKEYILNEYYLYSNGDSDQFNFISSIGLIKQKGDGMISAIVGKERIYISESGWYSVGTEEIGNPLFYAIDFSANNIWQYNFNNLCIRGIKEIENNEIYILTASDNDAGDSLIKISKDGTIISRIDFLDSIDAIYIDDEVVYAKYGSKVSCLHKDGALQWEIELGTDRGVCWESIIPTAYGVYYGYQYENNHYIICADENGKIINKYKSECYTSEPVFDESNNMIYFFMDGNVLAAFDIALNCIKYQFEFKKYSAAEPIILGEYIIICYERKVAIFTKELIPVSTHNVKGNIISVSLTNGGILEILTCDYRAWDSGKSDICYSMVYELNVPVYESRMQDF